MRMDHSHSRKLDKDACYAVDVNAVNVVTTFRDKPILLNLNLSRDSPTDPKFQGADVKFPLTSVTTDACTQLGTMARHSG